MSCPVHSKNKMYDPNDLQFLVQKYQSKKRGYKESMKLLRNDLKQLLEEKYKQDDKIVELQRQIMFQKQQQQQKQHDVPLLDNQNQQIIEKLSRENEQNQHMIQQIQLENITLKTQLHGKNEECMALHQELQFYQQRTYKIYK